MRGQQNQGALNPMYGQRTMPKHTEKREEVKLNVNLVHALVYLRNIINTQEDPVSIEQCQMYLTELLGDEVKESKVERQVLRITSILTARAQRDNKKFESLDSLEQEQLVVDLIADLQETKNNPAKRV
jgi:hypothetical protein